MIFSGSGPVFRIGLAGVAVALVVLATSAAGHSKVSPEAARRDRADGAHEGPRFQPSGDCQACHNGLTTASGEDVSIGVAWRASMMANSARDPYWLGSVRREMADHPTHRADIEDECAICHMPMARALAVHEGRKGEIFRHLNPEPDDVGHLASDGVSCTLCHQIGAEGLGTPASFTGGFVLAPADGDAPRIVGPYDVTPGHAAVMRSSTGYRPASAPHLRGSEFCATCHTLITQAFGPTGDVIGRLPEQVPFQEWQHSAWRSERTCQQCHMPPVETPTRVTSVFGEPRERLGRHTFLGGNFMMLRLLNRHRAELGVVALPQELEAAARATTRQLEADTAAVSITRADRAGGQITIDVAVSNRAGHKLPTGYPARRAWLHLVVADADGRTLFQSGAPLPNGAIKGNDGDEDPRRFEPHRATIRTEDEVQVYEAVMADAAGLPTTGLLSAVRFVKDNRLLPRGFDKRSAGEDIAVRGEALQDEDFTEQGDRVRYEVAVSGARGPIQISVELRYQPIAYRWAVNLGQYAAPEAARFVRYYEEAAPFSSVVLARAVARLDRPD